MLHRQRGAYSLYAVAIWSVLAAGLAMAGLMSVRHERNYFAEGMVKVAALGGERSAGAALDAAGDAVRGAQPAGDGKLRRCVIDGKTVVSNTDCTDTNPTSKVIVIRDTKGFEAPRKPAEPAPEAGAPQITDKLIEKQLR